MKLDTIQLDPSNKDVTLTAILHPNAEEFTDVYRPAMIVCPGGAYAFCSEREAETIALPYSKAGYQTFVLRYSVNESSQWPKPFEDFKNAYSTIIDNADNWQIDTQKICTVGFSAGGHLAAIAATSSEVNIAACILVYPALLQNILGLLKENLPDPPMLVTKETCPCFIAAARDDRTVNIDNTIAMQQALLAHEVPFESHIYSYGGHGFSSGEEWLNFVDVCPRVPGWIPDSIEWLGETIGRYTAHGYVGQHGMNPPSADDGVCISCCCSFEFVYNCKNPEIDVVMQPVYDAIKDYSNKEKISYSEAIERFKPYTVAEICEKIGLDMKTVRQVHLALRKIKDYK